MTISQNIDALPTAPTRSDPASFDTRADAYLSALVTFSTQIETFRTQANTTASNINADKTAAEAAQSAAEAAQSLAEYAENGALAAAQFKGAWSALSGVLARPATVRHDDAYWLLLPASLANVAASEPSDDNADWARLNLGGGIIAA